MVAEAPDLATPEWLIEHIDDLGTPRAYNHYAVGWAHAMDTPYQWTKQVASHWGGTRNGTIVHWPERHRGQGRDPQPVPPRHRRRADRARGRRAAVPDDGQRRRCRSRCTASSMALLASTTRDAAERHETQYFEMMCNRGIYHKGWTAVTQHAHPVGGRGRSRGRSTPTSGSSTTRPRTGRRPTTSPPSSPRSSPSCSGCSRSRRPSTTCSRSTTALRRALQPRDRRPAQPGRGQHAAPVRRHAPPAGERRHQHQEQVALGHRRDRRPRRRRRRA